MVMSVKKFSRLFSPLLLVGIASDQISSLVRLPFEIFRISSSSLGHIKDIILSLLLFGHFDQSSLTLSGKISKTTRILKYCHEVILEYVTLLFLANFQFSTLLRINVISIVLPFSLLHVSVFNRFEINDFVSFSLSRRSILPLVMV